MIKNRSARRLACCLAALFIVTAVLAGPAAAAAPKRVAIVPFTANAQKDISFLIKGIRDMLASRLAWKQRVVVIEPDLVQRAMKKLPAPTPTPRRAAWAGTWGPTRWSSAR